MNLYDIVAAGPVLYLNRESGILASYSGGNINVYEYEGMEQGREFDKAGLVPTYNLIKSWPMTDSETDLVLGGLLILAQEYTKREA